MRRLLVPALALLLAGCTTTSRGAPTAGDRPPKTTSSPDTTTTTTTVDRPRNIDLAAVDICQVVGGLPRATYGLDTDRPPLAGESSIFPGSKDCFAGGIQQNLSLLVVAVATTGTTEYLDGANAEINQTDANGFPLFVLTTPPSPDSCFGAVDVNDGQMLFINYGMAAPGTEPATPQTTLCQRIPDIARAAVALL
jgi:hypothetical protein